MPALWRLRQKDLKFEISLSYVVKLCFKTTTKKEERERKRKALPSLLLLQSLCPIGSSLGGRRRTMYPDIFGVSENISWMFPHPSLFLRSLLPLPLNFLSEISKLSPPTSC
jgi:hypothetical protein